MDSKTTKTAAVSSPATGARAGGQGQASQMVFAPDTIPAGFKKRATGNLPFFRCAPGDVFQGVIAGKNDQLSQPDPETGAEKLCIYVELAYAAHVTMKNEKGELVETIAPAGSLINVGVRAQMKKSLTKPVGTRVWVKVGSKDKIKGGKTMYNIETGDDGPDDDMSSEETKSLGANGSASLPEHASA